MMKRMPRIHLPQVNLRIHHLRSLRRINAFEDLICIRLSGKLFQTIDFDASLVISFFDFNNIKVPSLLYHP